MHAHGLEDLWHLLLGGDTAAVAALLDRTERPAWDDPLFNAESGDAVASRAIPRLSAWYRERAAAAPIEHLRTTMDAQRIIVESVLPIRGGVIWNATTQAAEPADQIRLAVAVVGQRSGETCRAIRIYFGTWSVLNGAPKVRVGPIAPDERAETGRALDGLPIIRRYFDLLATGAPEIIECFEPDGYFREPANNFAAGRTQLEAHFSHILHLGGVGIDFLTATRQDQRLGLELQTITWGPKQMDQPQAGFAIYELGPHGKIAGSRVYDSVVPPAL